MGIVSASVDSDNNKTKAVSVTEQKLDIKAKSVILMEPYTGKILYEDNADEVLPPASITKVMSLLLVMEAIKRGDFTTETVVTASEHACSMGG
ncbi:MAG: D-alanyl-D-alanine carboxypeptidase, partial [Clostridia bacterium]|nr:D-alanyl-D-alanine carboxypeptidase [Clostridia bacterium]